MVFDIDMDAYDDVRSCCSGANVCQKCWSFLNLAAKLLTDMLKEDFEFENCLWVFSGRRGVHCWVCDPEARNMSNEMRSAVTQYCSINVGNENAGKLKLDFPLHPSLRRAHKFLEKYFEEFIVVEQDLLSDQKHRDRFLQYLPNDELRYTVSQKWKSHKDNGQQMWKIWHQVYNEWKMNVEFKKVSLTKP